MTPLTHKIKTKSQPGSKQEHRQEKEKQTWKRPNITDVKRPGNTRIRRIGRHR